MPDNMFIVIAQPNRKDYTDVTTYSQKSVENPEKNHIVTDDTMLDCLCQGCKDDLVSEACNENYNNNCYCYSMISLTHDGARGS